ncbi:MAG: hypothetical protein CSB44_08615 [Gammaproteobacteria bacterium]|nr:MAG: hypothetical protein CSB44_08615 [Gammaproteobacteria bacterium]
MRELDEALLAWLDERYPDASEDERIRFRELIDMEDPELFGLLTGKIKEDRYAELVSRIGKTLQGRAG